MRSTGKTSTAVFGDTKYTKVLGIANVLLDNWQNEFDWNSQYNPALTITTVTNTDTFAIPVTVRKFSEQQGDPVRINWTDGIGYTDYDLIPSDDLKLYYGGQTKQSPYGNYCAQIGSNLVFNHTFISTDKQFGGTIKAPVYIFVTPLVLDTDVVPVAIPNWLVAATAAEYVRTDITLQNQYPQLLAEANDLLQKMIDNEGGQFMEVYRQPIALGATW